MGTFTSLKKFKQASQLKTDLAAIDHRILLSITPESGATEEGEVVEQPAPMAQKGETKSLSAEEQHKLEEKQEVKSGVKFRM